MKPVIFGLSGETLTADERAFFAEAQPAGYILFKRNIADRAQVRALTDETKLEESIDQEIRRILGTYSRARVEGSPEWEVMYRKIREEVYKKRFRQ